MVDKDIIVKLYRDKYGNDFVANHLPHDTQLKKVFQKPLTICVRNLSDISGLELQVTKDVFLRIWPYILKELCELPVLSTGLVYFRGSMVNNDLLGVFPYLSVHNKGDGRFYIPELCKTDSSSIPICGSICFEYCHDAFVDMTCPSGYSFFSGAEIIGLFTSESYVEKAIRMNVFEKNILESLLGLIDCLWICDSDLEGMTIWHKSYPSTQLSEKIQSLLINRFKLQVEIC